MEYMESGKVMTFGTGDIAITAGYMHENGRVIGTLGFINCPPVGIGTILRANKQIDISEYPVLMKFTNKDSIDVLIYQLNEAKKHMM